MPHIDEVMITVTRDPGKHFFHSMYFRTYSLQPQWGFLGGSVVKKPPVSSGDARDTGSIPGSGRSPGRGHATHSSILAWRIPWREESGALSSIGSHRIGQN